MSLPQGGHTRLDNAWLTPFIQKLPTADAICLYLQSRSNLRRKGADLGELISALGPRDLRTVERTIKALLAHGRIVRQGAHYYAPACSPAATPAQPPAETPAPAPAVSPGNSSETQGENVRHDDEIGERTAAQEKEEKEEKKREEHQERECARARTEDGDPSLSGEGGQEGQGSGGASGAGAPGGARPGPALTVTGFGQPPGGEEPRNATSVENVPPGAAGGAPSDPTRAALEATFGPPFLARLLSEGPLRPGWLGLSAERVAELYQEALDTSGDKPWKTLLISQLDIEVAKGRARRSNLTLPGRREHMPREQWLP